MKYKGYFQPIGAILSEHYLIKRDLYFTYFYYNNVLGNILKNDNFHKVETVKCNLILFS